jgi:acetamidase/formamidase
MRHKAEVTFFSALLLSLVIGNNVLAEIHEIYPKTYSRVFSAFKEPVLRIKSGDTIITRTWDAFGEDYKNVRHIENPFAYPELRNALMGPFYVEGTDHGDALEIHLDKVRLNRNWGWTTYRLGTAFVDSNMVQGLYKNSYKQGAVRPERDNLIPWDLDLERGVANPQLFERSGMKFDLPVKPMLGCIGLAPAGEEVQTSGPSGSYGGNMDYNDMVEGASLFLPVYHPGAFLYIGDGHALQGDGEGLGTGIETSLDVQFTVTVHKGKRLALPRLVNAEYLISIASQPEFSSNLDVGLQRANSDMIQWLTSEYKLTQPEAHLLLGTVVQHKIVTYFGTVVTMIPRRYLPKY